MKVECPECKGKGEVALFVSVVECDPCDGTGKVEAEYEQDWAMVEKDEPTEEPEDAWFDLGSVDWNSLIP